MNLATQYTELGKLLKPILQKGMDTYGILMEKFYIENVSLPKVVEKIIDKKTQLNILKNDLNDFNKMQGGIALEKLAENENAGGMGAVVLTNLMNQQTANANTANNVQVQQLELLKQLAEL